MLRRTLARKHLKANEIPVTVTSFPLLGVQGQFTEPGYDPSNAVSSHSLFLPEQITNPHARFPYAGPPFLSYIMQRLTNQYSTLTANIRTRRGSKAAINLPIFFDEKTTQPFIDPTIPWDRKVYPEDLGMWLNTVWRNGLR